MTKTLIFEDLFPGTTLDPTKWVTYLGEQGTRWDNRGQLPYPYSAGNVGGFGLEMYDPAQVVVNDGLFLRAGKNINKWAGEYPWISGVVTTEGKFELPEAGWVVEVIAQMPDVTHGMWPAIWFLPGVPGTPANEFDGYEGGFTGGGHPPNDLMHLDYWSPEGQKQALHVLGFDASQGPHIYAFEWIPNKSITAWVDSLQIYSLKEGLIPRLRIPAQPYQIMLQLQVAGPKAIGWHTTANAATQPATMKVSQVRAWSL